MIWLKNVLVFSFMCFLCSCAMVTPEIHLKVSGLEMELRQSAPMSASAAISSDGKYVLTGGDKDYALLWDMSKGSVTKKLPAGSTKIAWMDSGIYVALSPDGKYAFSGGEYFKQWDLSSGKEIRTIGNLVVVHAISVSSDGRKVLAVGRDTPTGDDRMVLYDVNSGNLDIEFKIEKAPRIFNTTKQTSLSPNGRYALSGCWNLAIIWDIATGKPIRVFEGSDGYAPGVYSAVFSPNGRYVISGGTDGTIRFWDILSGTEFKRITAHTGSRGVRYVSFSPNGKNILSSGATDGLIKLWDTSSGIEVKTFRSRSRSTFVGAPKDAAFSPDGKYIITEGGDASVRIFDVSTGEEIAVMIGFEDGEWLAITSEGYYNASDKGAQHLGVKFQNNNYNVDQFYDVFYRPDIVAAKLRGEDISGLVTITMQDAIKSPPPLVEVTSHSPGKDREKAKVCYRVKSTGGGIGEVRLFHNGKLIQSDGYYREVAKSATAEKMQLASLNSRAIYDDMRYLTIKAKTDSNLTTTKPKGDLFEDCKEIDAIPGENEVSVSAFNSGNTVQSYMKTVNFNSSVKSEDPHLYILSIGIDQYRDSSVNLKYAVKDAKDIENKLKTQAATLYKAQNIHYELLTDEEATKAKIAGKINNLSTMIKPQDGFILFVAGHGVLLQNQYYMLTHDFNGRVSDTNMVSSNEIVEASKKIKSLSQLFIFDTCHAGGVDTIVSGLYDARMSVLAKKMGLHIYASASDKQAAMDGYKGNGLFTYTLLDGLNNNRQADRNKDGKVSVMGLGGYSKERTTQLSKEIGHSQTPLIINFGKDYPIYQLR
jgi:WD40 repeat protein